MRNWGIRTRVLLLALLPAVIIAVTLAGYMAYRVSSDFERDLQNYGLGLSRQLAAVSEFSTYSGDREALRKVTLAALDDSYVSAAAVFDEIGVPIASSGALPSQLPSTPLANEAFLMDSDEERMLFAAPIVLHRYEVDDPFLAESTPPAWPRHPAAIGWVILEISRAATVKRKQEAIFFTGLSTLAVLFLGGTLALLLGRQVTRPILRLEESVARIQAGDLGARVPADSGGDLQRLEEGMNAMATALQENREQLQARIRAATHELEEKKNEAERASIAKSRFLAAASHDLRQPLHALSLFAADLLREANTPAEKRLAGPIGESVRHISELLDALLDISRLDVAGVTPQIAPLPLRKLFGHLDNNFARAAEARGLRFRCRPSSLWVQSDPVLLVRLLSNLVANAVDYTRQGGILIAARRRGPEVRIEVRDSGIGIAEEHSRAVFEEFYQVGNIARTQGQGLGLGLAIVTRLAHILGARVDLRSKPGRGSVFAVTLPLLTTPPLAVAPPLPSEPRPLVLLLGDCPAFAEIGELLAGWGWGCEEERPSSESLRRAHRENLVVMTDAEEAGRLELAEGEEMPVLVILGEPDVSHEALATRPGGPVHHLPLPPKPAKLRALLARLLAPTA